MATPTAQPSAAQRAAMAQQMNINARNAVLSSSVDMIQSVAAQQVFPASQNIAYIQPRYVGLIKRFTIQLQGVFTNTGTTTLTLTSNGLANLLSNVQFTDLTNYQRINTTGLHLQLNAWAKRRRSYFGSVDTNIVTGNNRSQVFSVPSATWPIFMAPTTIAAGTTAPFTVYFEVPLAYSDDDLRGALYANVVNSTAQLQLTFNTNCVSVGTADPTFAVYSGAAGSAGSIQSVNYTVYQEYLYNLPTAAVNGQSVVLLPTQDLSTVYELKNTNFSSITATQDFPMSYSNFRSFLSTWMIYNSAGTAAGLQTGGDVNYWGLQAANMTYLKKYDPITAAAYARNLLGSDTPPGTYYFQTRNKPVETIQYGNMQMVLNPSAATGAATVQAMWEMFSQLNTIPQSSSLPAS